MGGVKILYRDEEYMCAIMRWVFFSLLFLGCSGKMEQHGPFHSLLMSADKTHIAFNFEKITSVVIRKEKEILNLLDIALSGKSEICKCNYTGLLGLYKRDSLLMNVWISTNGTGGTENCEYLMINEGNSQRCYKMTYRLGMYLDELYNEIKPE